MNIKEIKIKDYILMVDMDDTPIDCVYVWRKEDNYIRQANQYFIDICGDEFKIISHTPINNAPELKGVNTTKKEVIPAPVYKHTEGKWKAEQSGRTWRIVAIEPNLNSGNGNKEICSGNSLNSFGRPKEESEANAAYIVKCVNSFPALVKENEDLKKEAKYNEKVAYDTSVTNANIMAKNAALVEALQMWVEYHNSDMSEAEEIILQRTKEALKNAAQ